MGLAKKARVCDNLIACKDGMNSTIGINRADNVPGQQLARGGHVVTHFSHGVSACFQ